MDLVVLDLGTSNMCSLTSALSYLGARSSVTTDPHRLDSATHVILPGVGAFDAAMRRMNELSLTDAVRCHAITRRRPLLGVCLGMQLLFDGSAEGRLSGLGIVSGRFTQLTPNPALRHKVPHVGFAPIYGFRESTLFQGLGARAAFYFTHSYALSSVEADSVAYCQHAEPFVAAFQRGTVCGAQFHPEKSQSNGLRLIANFLQLRAPACVA